MQKYPWKNVCSLYAVQSVSTTKQKLHKTEQE